MKLIDIRKLRKEKKLTQEQLGDKVGVVHTMISNIEVGRTQPSVQVAKALGRELGFDWWKFFEQGSQR